jgi:hypothetical protein
VKKSKDKVVEMDDAPNLPELPEEIAAARKELAEIERERKKDAKTLPHGMSPADRGQE